MIETTRSRGRASLRVETFSSENVPKISGYLVRFCTMLVCPEDRAPFLDRRHETIRNWFHRLTDSFDFDCDERQQLAVGKNRC